MTDSSWRPAARRADPYPWTWEPAALAGVFLVSVLAVGVQVGRSVANLTVGGEWVFPDPTRWLTSIPGVLAGNPAAGLAPPPTKLSGAAGLGWSIGLVETALTVLVGATVVGCWRWWRPTGLPGMASRTEAEQVLGAHRLRAAAPILRPDLHPPTRTRQKAARR